MNSSQFENQWQQLRNTILAKWNKLTEEDLRQIGGRYDLFIAKLQEKYGYTREQAETQVDNWQPTFRTDARETARADRDAATARTNWLPWLLIGLATILFLTYFGSRNEPTKAETVPATEETTTRTSSSTDALTTQSIRDQLAANDQINTSGSDIKIETTDGRVTITGTVSTDAQKSLVSSIAEKTPNVTKVINLLQVKP